MAVQNRKRYAIVNEKQCVGCGSCIKVCPRAAISVPHGISAQIDIDKCLGCGLCRMACPASVIDIVTVTKESKEDKKN